MIATFVLSIATATPTSVAFLHLVPQPSARSLSTSSLLRIAADTLEARTSLTVLSPERAGASRARLDACPLEALYACWFREFRPLEKSGTRFLITVIENDGPNGTAELNFVLIDLDVAAEARIALGPNASDDEIESKLYAHAQRVPAMQIERTESAVDEAVRDLVDNHLRAAFEATGHWGRVVVPPPAALVTPTAPAYTASLYGGAGATAVGVAFLIVAFVNADDQLGCLAGPDADAPNCRRVAPVTFMGPAGVSVGDAPAAPFVTPGALGLALVGLGASVATTTFLAYERTETPWWAWAAGTIGGVVAFALGSVVTNR